MPSTEHSPDSRAVQGNQQPGKRYLLPNEKQRCLFKATDTLESQLFQILDFRSNETLQNTNRDIRGNLEALQRIALETQHNGETLADLAHQNQRDSKTLKALSFIAVIFLPASLIAVCMPTVSPYSALLQEYITKFNPREF
jgi:hypothetical protein